MLAAGGAGAYFVKRRSGSDWKLKYTLTGHTDSVQGLGFEEFGSMYSPILASCGLDKTIRFWDLATGKPWGSVIENPIELNELVFDIDGQTLAVACLQAVENEGGVRYWTWNDAFNPDPPRFAGRLKGTVPPESDSSGFAVLGVAMSNTGILAYSNISVMPPDETPTVSLTSLLTVPPVAQLTGPTNVITSLAFNTHATQIAAGSGDMRVWVWDFPTGQLQTSQVLQGHEAAIWSVAFSHDEHLLASGSEDMTVRVWVPRGGELLHTLTGHTGKVKSIAFDPTGHIVASGSEDKTVRLWDAAEGKLLHTFTDFGDSVERVAFSRDGKYFAAAGKDHVVRVWTREV